MSAKMALMVMTIMMINLMKTKNPMKTCWKLMMMMILTSYTMYTTMNNSFFPLIMMMIMVGGLLIMYMIMSSMMPNNPMKTSKTEKTDMIMLSFMAMILLWTTKLTMSLSTQIEYLSNMIMQLNLFSFLIVMMMIYFYSMTSYLESENLSLRSRH